MQKNNSAVAYTDYKALFLKVVESGRKNLSKVVESRRDWSKVVENARLSKVVENGVRCYRGNPRQPYLGLKLSESKADTSTTSKLAVHLKSEYVVKISISLLRALDHICSAARLTRDAGPA